MICRKCQQYGHPQKYCTGHLTCGRCGKSGHDAGGCGTDSIKCYHCGDCHFVGYRSCPEQEYQAELITVSVKENITKNQARVILETKYNRSRMNFAKAVRRDPEGLPSTSGINEGKKRARHDYETNTPGAVDEYTRTGDSGGKPDHTSGTKRTRKSNEQENDMEWNSLLEKRKREEDIEDKGGGEEKRKKMQSEGTPNNAQNTDAEGMTEIVCISPTSNTLFSTEVDLQQLDNLNATSENNSEIRKEALNIYNNPKKNESISGSQQQQFDIDQYEKELEQASSDKRSRSASKIGKERWSASRSRSRERGSSSRSKSKENKNNNRSRK